ncbi:hypothetical protein M422DRAFT_96759, partial [Sphaerobolus stellatus SS14]
IAKTVHFFDDGCSILVGYMESHRVRAWTISPWTRLWERMVFSRIAKTAMSPRGEYLLVHNMVTGCDAYTIPEMGRHASSTFTAPVISRKPINVGFASAGSLVIQGGSRGQIFLHIFENANLFQILQH